MSGAEVVGVAVVGLALLAVAIVVAPSYLRRMRGELSRADGIARVAQALGLSFSPDDPAFPGSTALRYPFELFSRGERQTCENVIAGSLHGRAVTAFDLLYSEHDAEPIRYTCAIAEIGGSVPHLAIEPTSPLPDMPAAHDGTRVALEWGDFNARYRVFTPERNFAPAALDLDLMAWLVDEAPHLALTWELQRGLVLCRGKGIAPPEFRDLIGAAVGFASRIRKAAGT